MATKTTMKMMAWDFARATVMVIATVRRASFVTNESHTIPFPVAVGAVAVGGRIMASDPIATTTISEEQVLATAMSPTTLMPPLPRHPFDSSCIGKRVITGKRKTLNANVSISVASL